MTISLSTAAKSRLESLEQRDGNLRIAAVVEDASDPESPLHPYFDWDDETAAASWRLAQAREIIRSVQIVIVTEVVTIRAPMYLRDPRVGAHQQGYSSLKVIRTDEDMAREAIVAEFARVRDCLTRAKTIALALSLEQDIARLLEDVAMLAQRIEEPPAMRQ